MPPKLFNTYSADIVKRALEDETKGIKINGMPVNNIRYADDTVILAEGNEGVQIMMDKVSRYSEDCGLTLNVKIRIFEDIQRLTTQGNTDDRRKKYTTIPDIQVGPPPSPRYI